jgi:hypothetical protein
MIENVPPRSEEQAAAEVTGQRDEHGFGRHNVDHIRERTASGRPQPKVVDPQRAAVEAYPGEDILLPEEPERRPDRVIEAINVCGGMAAAWRPSADGRWVQFGGTSWVKHGDWADIVKHAIRNGCRLVIREGSGPAE